MSFLPTDYEVPVSSGNFTKLEKGDTRFRVMSSAIIGYESWIGGKSVRRRMDEEFTPEEIASFDKNKDGSDKRPKHFWAFVVYNYTEKRLQIMEITQKTIMNAMNGFIKEEGWGAPQNYDIKITREGEGLSTEYSVVPTPPKPVAPEIAELYKNATINLEALFSGADPFAK